MFELIQAADRFLALHSLSFMIRRLSHWLFLFMLLAGTASAESPEDGSLLQRAVAFFSRDLKVIDADILKVRKELLSLPVPPTLQQTGRLGFRTNYTNKDTKVWIVIDLQQMQHIDQIVLVPVDINFVDWPGPGFGFPVRFRIEVADNPEFKNADQVIGDEDKDYPNPGSYPAAFDLRALDPLGVDARYVRIEATKLWSRRSREGFTVGQKVLALGEIMVLSGPVNVAAGLRSDAVSCSDSYEAEWPSWSKSNLIDGLSTLGPPISGEGGPANGFCSAFRDKSDAEEWVQVDLGESLDIREIRLVPARPSESPELRSFGFPRRFGVQIADDPEFKTSPKPVNLGYRPPESSTDIPNENPISLPAAGTKGRYVRVSATKLGRAGNKFAFALAELQVYVDRRNAALGKKVTCSSSAPPAKRKEDGHWGPALLVDGMTSQGRLIEWESWLKDLERRNDVEMRLTGLTKQRESTVQRQVEGVLSASGYTVLAIVLASMYFSFRANIRKRRDLEALRTRIARDVHDEIGSGLGTISLLSQLAQESEPDEARQDLGEIHRISVGMAAAMRDIVWFNRTDVDSVRDLIMRMRETAESMLAGKEVRFETLGDELVKPIAMERRREIFLVFKEALHNIIKHAEATCVDIAAGLDNNLFRLTIRDNGRGFDPQLQKSGAGMGSMKQRAETLKGQLVFETNPGSGTALSLVAKLR